MTMPVRVWCAVVVGVLLAPIDAYIGEETGPGFTDGPWYTTLNGATLDLG
jgi:hypothetical protein